MVQFVNNTLIAYVRLPRRDQGIVYKIGPRNRHLVRLLKHPCINNRTILHDTKGVVPILYCFRKMHHWGSKWHAVSSIPRWFISDGALIWGRCQSVWPYYNGYMTGRGGFLGGAREWFKRSYIIVTPCLWLVRIRRALQNICIYNVWYWCAVANHGIPTLWGEMSKNLLFVWNTQASSNKNSKRTEFWELVDGIKQTENH